MTLENDGNTNHNFVGTNHEGLSGNYILSPTSTHGSRKNSFDRSNSGGIISNNNISANLSHSTISGTAQQINKTTAAHNTLLAQSRSLLHANATRNMNNLNMNLGMGLSSNKKNGSPLQSRGNHSGHLTSGAMSAAARSLNVNASMNPMNMHPLHRYMPISMYAGGGVNRVDSTSAAVLSDLDALNCYEDMISSASPSNSASAAYLNSANFYHRSLGFAPSHMYDPLALDAHLRMKAFSAAQARAQAQVQAAAARAHAHTSAPAQSMLPVPANHSSRVRKNSFEGPNVVGAMNHMSSSVNVANLGLGNNTSMRLSASEVSASPSSLITKKFDKNTNNHLPLSAYDGIGGPRGLSGNNHQIHLSNSNPRAFNQNHSTNIMLQHEQKDIPVTKHEVQVIQENRIDGPREIITIDDEDNAPPEINLQLPQELDHLKSQISQQQSIQTNHSSQLQLHDQTPQTLHPQQQLKTLQNSQTHQQELSIQHQSQDVKEHRQQNLPVGRSLPGLPFIPQHPATPHLKSSQIPSIGDASVSHPQKTITPYVTGSIPLPKQKKPRKPRGPNKKKKLPITLSKSFKAGECTTIDMKTPGEKDDKPQSKQFKKEDKPEETLNLYLPPPPKEIKPWFSSYVPLGSEQDKYWLSELQCYIRSNIVEAFGATEKDVAVLRCGRSKPISLGQVGIRCMYCRDVYPVSDRGQQAVSYPGLIQGIYNSVQQMLRAHFETCTRIPPDVRSTVESLRASTSARGGRKQYWEDSAIRLGLVDTRKGIYFSWDPKKPMPEEFREKMKNLKELEKGESIVSQTPTTPRTGGSIGTGETSQTFEGTHVGTPTNLGGDIKAEVKNGEQHTEIIPLRPASFTENNPALMEEESYELVLEEDEPLISDYLYLALRQMKPCLLNNADLVGCYKDRETGFRGLACKHCIGQAGCGRYFPASEASLSQTTTSHTIFNHVRSCRRVPIDIRSELEMMKRGRLGPDGKKIKPKHGGRKVFFHRLWCRIQGLKIIEEDHALEEKKKKKKLEEQEKAKKRAAVAAKKKKDKAEKERLAKLARSKDNSYAGRRRQRKRALKATRTSNRKPKKRTFDDHLTEESEDDEEGYYSRKYSRSRKRHRRKSHKSSRKSKSYRRHKKRNSDDSTVTEFTSDGSDYDRERSVDSGLESSVNENRIASSYGDSSTVNSDIDSLNESDSETESQGGTFSGKEDLDKSDLDGEENSLSSEEDDEEWFDGTVSLAKRDDPYWLSEVQCYVRSDMIEVFSASEEDVKERGRHIFVGLGNVGLRCVYCAQCSDRKRSKESIIFPSKLSNIHQAVQDLQRRHFSSCPEMPRHIRETYKSMRGFTTKEDDETQQYWIDAAKDIGLSNSPHGGMIFKRDPKLKSYADTLHDNGNKNSRDEDRNKMSIAESTNGLIRAKDKQLITDFYLFLFGQVVPCLFREKDRRKGTGLRRDMKVGFPGLQCRHCEKKTNSGRYFPFSPKSLADNTTHSLFVHIQGCPHCPEMNKSSLAYLTHRSLLQKNELKRGWKRDLFQKVWDRLHNEKSWVNSKFVYDEDDEEAEEFSLNQHGKETFESHKNSIKADDEETLNSIAQILINLEGEAMEDYDSDSGVESEELGSDVGEAMQGFYPRRSKRKRNPPQSPVLTRARRSVSLIFRGDNSSRMTRKRRRVHAS